MKPVLRTIFTQYHDYIGVEKSCFLVFKAALFFLILTNCVNAQEAGADAEPQQVNALFWLLKVSGWIGVFILLLSIYFVSLLIRSILEIRESVVRPPEVCEAVNSLLAENKTKEAIDVLQADDSAYSKVLLAGIADLKYGFEDAREKLYRTIDDVAGGMERSISNLAVLGTLGPMIGLLGTLKGMISSFAAIAISGTSLEAAKIAEGISEALVLTFEGVLLSVPAIFFYSYFRNKIAAVISKLAANAEDELRAFASRLKTKQPPQV